MRNRRSLVLGASLLAGFVFVSSPAASAQLRVGASRVDITPDPKRLPEPFISIHDPIFTRAIFIEAGGTCAVLLNVDVGNMTSTFADSVAAEITQQFKVLRENMILSSVHIHSSVGNIGAGAPGNQAGLSPNTQAFVRQVHDGMLAAVQQARAALQPAEMGFGEGKLYLNVNRDAIDLKTRLWAQEANPELPSDKTVAVLEFRRSSGGEPIAIYANYAMHAVTMFLRGDISGDFPEVASRYIEDNYGGRTVALWTQGAEGDQNPLDMRPILAINEERIHHEMDPAKPNDPSEYNSAIMRLFLGGAKRPDLPIDPRLAEQSWQVVRAIGTTAAEAILRVTGQISHFGVAPTIQGSSTVVTCPGRKRLDDAREGVEGRYEDGPPAAVQAGALRIGDVALGYVNGEPYNKIGQEVKQGSPFRNTMVVALAGGGPNGGYMPSDDAYGHLTFQVLGTRFKAGCAETGVVNAINGLLEKYLESAPQP